MSKRFRIFGSIVGIGLSILSITLGIMSGGIGVVILGVVGLIGNSYNLRNERNIE